MFGHNKSASASSISSPNKPSAGDALGLEKAITVSNPVDLSTVLEANTPPGSPTGKKFPDGPVSASKSKLYAAIRAAKEKFIGSSAASAQAKLDALSQSPQRQLAPKASFESIFSPKKRSQPAQPDERPVSRDSKDEGRRTRSSTEREEKRKEQETREAMDKQRADENLEKIREKERQKAATQFQKAKAIAREPQKALSRPDTAGKAEGTAAQDERPTSSHRMPPPAAQKNTLPTGGQKLREPKRLLKAASKDTLPKAKPPVIRVNLTGSRFGQPAAQATQAQPKQPEIANKASAETLNRTASSSHPPPRMNRALIAAANKKKEEERKAAEKEQKKRELEQKRAQKAEDEKLEKERKAAEQRELMFKKARAAQKAATEEKERAERELTEQKAARLADQERTKATLKAIAEAKQKHQERMERQERQQAERQQAERQQAARPASRPGQNNLTNALQQEKAQNQPHPRADLGAAKSVSRMQTIQDQTRPVPPINPAKPPKRVFQPEDDEPVQRPGIQRAGPSFQQQDGKRRKTVDEEDEYEQHMPSVKAPPIRHSNMRKDAANRFPSGYMQAPQQTSTMLKTATGHAYTQQQMKSSQTGEMARFANGKIPFAEVPNPPASTNHYGQNYKTPVRGMLSAAPSTTKSSPSSFNPGNEIELPDCFTDSEDDDDENGFVRPDWANTPQLQELLKAQQLIDPETIFGPIQPLNMEKIFKDHPERHEKFRKRTSSARWTNDEITESEKKRDREARERLFRDGHWTYHPSPAPTLNKRN
ncbi:uncharacterized protein BDZ99DRAFT_413407 [Mytilinidion resinicola]|uniref:Inner centromere protein ARK-binding domain-containing protein n=1 Tax=Mytilinidion resinicola TaxID=574789 RepID=A0A6A6YUF4_9PEZI|nr:uncharacterized protein BDZ99DRAFT_413407 [Mytilinidion resinicola]KAF2812586.1 hypothetical protein BDZ99DRAFT_413407 [Mytilinidion resinicola]